MYNIFIVSDGTGRTAKQALQAALTQFQDIPVSINNRPGIRSKEQVQKVVAEVAKAKGFIVHTLVMNKVRMALVEAMRLQNVDAIDIMRPLLSKLAHQFDINPIQKPGLFQELNREYFKRMDAMQFAFTHDDGHRSHELNKAEIVLIGVSRTFKTPISIFLAFKGWFVANVPLITGIKPPDALFAISPEKVFCLTTNAKNLSVLRKVREEHLGGTTGDYASFSFIRKELLFAQSVFNKQPKWPVITVTGKPIEEISSEILTLRENHS